MKRSHQSLFSVKNRAWSLALAILFGLVPGGCSRSGDGPSRFDLSGKVTYQGTPVPAGEITFTPDTEKGNSGPGTMATIRNGEFRTPPGKGTIGGPHVVRIIGHAAMAEGAAPPPGEEAAPVGRLFKEYVTNVDLPASAATHDFEVAETSH